MEHIICRVCNSDHTENLLHRISEFTVTSAQIPTSLKTIDVRLCLDCSHVQSRVIDDLSHYYDNHYNFHLSSEDVDDIYTVRDGKSVYRADHQRHVIASAYDLNKPLRILDYGCGKAKTLKDLHFRFPAIEPLVFDVSDAYKKYWDKFVDASNQAVHSIPNTWNNSCDMILSFFSLEHVADPQFFASDTYRLLRPGGRLHLLVPDMFQNMCDMLVVDHINHFSKASLKHLLEKSGFTDIQFEDSWHRAALTVTAKRPANVDSNQHIDNTVISGDYIEKARRAAKNCLQLFEKIEKCVISTKDQKTAIFGSGIYGLLTLSSIKDRNNIIAFLDNNKFRQQKTLFDIPILPPASLPAETECVIVALNPHFAKEIVSSTISLHEHLEKLVYL